MLIAVAATWAQGSITVVAEERDKPAVHERRRTALAAAVRGMFEPAG